MSFRFHVGEYLRDEIAARGWTAGQCAVRMGGNAEENLLSLKFLLACADMPDDKTMKAVRLGEVTARKLSRAFGTSKALWLRLDESFHAKDAAKGE